MDANAIINLILKATNLGSPEVKNLSKDLAKLDDAGAKSQRTMKAAGAVASGIMAAGFGAASRGGLQLERIEGQLQAQTGASADEAKRLTQAVNAIAGDTRQPLEEVSGALESVMTNLGLSGDAATTTTRRFVDFSRATGQDASDAVSSFDDILDAWGLQATDANAIMDQLIASHQKFGGSVMASEQALSDLAPAFTAIGASTDDALAYINLFNASGVDTSTIATAMAKALDKVKSPQELAKLVDDIAATDDEFKRAQMSADLFGAKAGPKMAAALRNAKGGLADYRIGMGEAAGATTRATKAVDDSVPIWEKAFAKIQSVVSGFGETFGSALTGAAAVASMTKGISSALGIAIPDGWKAAAGKVAGKLALPVTAIVTVVGAAEAVDSMVKGWDEATTTFRNKVTEALSSGDAAMMQNVRTEIDRFVQSQSGVWDVAGLKTKALTAIEASAKELDAYLAAHPPKASMVIDYMPQMLEPKSTPIAPSAGQLIADGAQKAAFRGSGNAAGTAYVQAYLERIRDQQTAADLVAKIYADGAEAKAAAAAVGKASAVSLADGMRTGREGVDSAWQGMLDALKNGLTPAKQAARDAGRLASKELAQALHSGKPEAIAAAKAVANAAATDLGNIAGRGGHAGRKAMHELEAAMHSKEPAVRHAAQKAMTAGIEALEKKAEGGGKGGEKALAALRDAMHSDEPKVARAARKAMDAVNEAAKKKAEEAKSAGQKFDEQIAAGIRGYAQGPVDAALALAGKLARAFPQSPVKDGPLSKNGGIVGMGRRISTMLGEGITEGTSSAAAAAHGAAAAIAAALDGVEPAMRRPVAGRASGLAAAGVPGSGGSSIAGDTYHVHVHYESLVAPSRRQMDEIADVVEDRIRTRISGAPVSTRRGQ